VFVVGVGTLGGGKMPAYPGPDGQEIKDPEVPLYSRLDRPSLQKVASGGHGQYFELDRDGDRRIANAIIDAGKRLAPSITVADDAEQLYWYFLSMAAVFVVSGFFFLRERGDLWLQLAGAGLALLWVSRVLNLTPNSWIRWLDRRATPGLTGDTLGLIPRRSHPRRGGRVYSLASIEE
jgi:hypothetical protein